MNPVNLRRAIGAADQDLLLVRMTIHSGESTFENRRGNRGDVVDESLRLDLGQLRGHVPPDGNHMRTVERKDGVEDPVSGSTAEKDLLAAGRFDGSQGVISTTKCNQLAVGRPAGSVDGVKGDRNRQQQLPLFGVPNLHFTHPCRQPSGDGEFLAVWREAHRLDPCREPDQTLHQSRVLDIVNQHLVKTGDRQKTTVGRVVEGGHDRRRFVDGRICLIVLLLGTGRGVVDRSLGNPAPDNFNLGRLQWITLVRHLCFAIYGSDQVDHQTLIRLMRNDRRFFATTGEKPIELRHHVLALGLGRLMTTVTIGLQDGTNLAIETDLVWRFLRFDVIVGKRRHRKHQ